jgi:hypothetical protein
MRHLPHGHVAAAWACRATRHFMRSSSGRATRSATRSLARTTNPFELARGLLDGDEPKGEALDGCGVGDLVVFACGNPFCLVLRVARDEEASRALRVGPGSSAGHHANRTRRRGKAHREIRRRARTMLQQVGGIGGADYLRHESAAEADGECGDHDGARSDVVLRLRRPCIGRAERGREQAPRPRGMLPPGSGSASHERVFARKRRVGGNATCGPHVRRLRYEDIFRTHLRRDAACGQGGAGARAVVILGFSLSTCVCRQA